MVQIGLGCVLCGFRESHVVSNTLRDSKNHRVVACKRCGHVQISPVPSKEDEKAFYDDDLLSRNLWGKKSVEGLRKISLNDIKRRRSLVERLLPQGSKICEIGSGYGFFLEEMSVAGYDIVGVEVSRERLKIASKVSSVRTLDLDLNIETPPARVEGFDAILMFHVLEHLTDPIGFLRKVHTMLYDDAYLIIECPNLDDLLLKASVPYRSFFWQRAHISYFDKHMLRRVLHTSGFSRIVIRGVQRYGIENFMHWLVLGKPQLESPSLQTTGSYSWLERYYKRQLTKRLRSDTLIAVAREKRKT